MSTEKRLWPNYAVVVLHAAALMLAPFLACMQVILHEAVATLMHELCVCRVVKVKTAHPWRKVLIAVEVEQLAESVGFINMHTVLRLSSQ